jgi:hypothetical protein
VSDDDTLVAALPSPPSASGLARLVGQGLLGAAIVAAALFVYDRNFVRPALRVGVIDLAAVYRDKERSFTQLLTTPGSSDTDRAKAMDMAKSFSEQLPIALDQLPTECRCLVFLRSAVAADTPNTIDLTPRLRAKLGL